jgi:hypothetical protein
MAKIFRYKLDDTIMTLIAQFAKIHEKEDRHAYKEAWAIWLIDNQDMVNREVNRLEELDYNGDILDKMFKAGRYYFREKAPKKKIVVANEVAANKVAANKVAAPQLAAKQQASAEPAKKKTRDYIVMDPVLIQAMDAHLKLKMKAQSFKPAAAYTDFCLQHSEILQKETLRLLQNITKEKLTAKIKKTYKNRYFILQQQ